MLFFSINPYVYLEYLTKTNETFLCHITPSPPQDAVMVFQLSLSPDVISIHSFPICVKGFIERLSEETSLNNFIDTPMHMLYASIYDFSALHKGHHWPHSPFFTRLFSILLLLSPSGTASKTDWLSWKNRWNFVYCIAPIMNLRYPEEKSLHLKGTLNIIAEHYETKIKTGFTDGR